MAKDTDHTSSRIGLLGVLTLALATLVNLRAAGQATGDCLPGEASVDLDVGNVRARILNGGNLFWRCCTSSLYEVPKSSGFNAIFASTVWVGGIVDGELRMAAATYSDGEFWPGPLDERGNPPVDCSVYDRIFLVDRSDLALLDKTGEATDDIRDWPWKLGAPVLDGDGNPDNYDIAAGDHPEILGDQMAWWVMNDAGNVHLTTHTEPIPLEVQVSAFAFGRDDAIGNTTFYRYRLVYRGESPWDSVYFGMWSDVDLGNENDDYIGSDSLRGIGYVYNGKDYDTNSARGLPGYGFPPPALAYDFLGGVIADADGTDNDHDGTTDEPGEKRSMTSFATYGSNSSVKGDPTNATEYYNYLRCRWRDGRFFTFGGTGRGYSETPTCFMFSGDPPDFWSEEQPTPGGPRNVPSDRRFVMATGPFSMIPADTVDIWLAIIWSRGADRLDSVHQLKEDSDLIQDFFDNGMRSQPQLPPATAPTLLAPADGILHQPVNPTLQWQGIPGINTYEWHIDDDVTFASPVASDSTTHNTGLLTEALSESTSYFWRVRAVNFAGSGPWSNTWTFTTGDASLFPGQSGLFDIDGTWPFVEVAGPGEEYACGPLAISTEGCDEIGGNFVYGSLNGAGNYIMYHEGTGTEATIAEFAPHDFEIRFTEQGSYAYHPFTAGKAIWLPFEVWDIGATYTGAAVNPNDPADDVQMIPNLFASDRDECSWFFDPLGHNFFEEFQGSTQRVYAYYPTGTYADWEDAVRPLVDAAPDGCPNAFDATGGTIEDHIDFDRGRPLQRIVFEGDPLSDPPYPAPGVVVRFYTEDRIPPDSPVPSTPVEGSTDLSVPITLAWNSASGAKRVEVATDAAFDNVVLSTSTDGFHYQIQSLPSPGTYYWRVNIAGVGGTSDWSTVSSFTASVVVGTEDESTVPDRFALEQNYPNPFNPSTTIRFALPSAEHVTINVYDVIGRRIARLVDDLLPAGRHRAVWDADRHASGLYLYRMRAGNFTESRTMLLIR